MEKGDRYFCPTDGNYYYYFATKKATDRKTDLLIFAYLSRWNKEKKRMELKLEQFNNLIKNKVWQKL
mgnify:FL=1